MNRKKLFLLIVIIMVATFATAFYFFAVHRMESSLKALVKIESDGKLNLNVKKVRLRLSDIRFDFKEVEINTVDDSNSEGGYQISADLLSVNVRSLMSVFRKSQLSIESIIIESPNIRVIKYKEKEHREISVPKEMGKAYKLLEIVLKVVNLNYMHISDARFIIDDRTEHGNKPLTISNINLTIDNVSNEDENGKNRFLFADRILLEIYNESIVFEGGNSGISFKRFWIGTQTQKVMLDSCVVFKKSGEPATEDFNIFIDSIRIKKLDFNALANENIIRFDSALCINPRLFFNLEIKERVRKKEFNMMSSTDRDSIESRIKQIIGNLEIGYLAVKNAEIDIVTEKNDKVSAYHTENSNFSIENLYVSKAKPVPIRIGRIDLNINNYIGYSPDSLYVITFDNVSVLSKKIMLGNFSILPVNPGQKHLLKSIKMETFEIDNIDWLTLIYDKRIVAGQASLVKPEVQLVLPGHGISKTKKQNTNPFQTLEKVRDKVQIDRFLIENGNLQLNVTGGAKVSLKNLYAGINVNDLLESDDILMVKEAVDTLSFAQGYFSNSKSRFSLSGTRYSGAQRSMQLQQITGTKTDKSQTINLKNVKLLGVAINSPTNISLDQLAWNSANIEMDLNSGGKDTAKAKLPDDYRFSIKKLSGEATQLKFKNQNLEASTVLNNISTREIILQSGKKPQINSLFIDGQKVALDRQNKIQGSLGDFQVIESQPSVIHNVQFNLQTRDEMITVQVPKLTFSLDINSCLNGNFNGEFVEFSNPRVTFTKNVVSADTVTQKKPGREKLPVINIKRITVEKPEIQSLPGQLAEKIRFNPGSSTITLNGIQSDSTHLQIEKFLIGLNQPSFQTNTMKLNSTGKEKIDILASNISFYPANVQSKGKWSFKLEEANLKDINLSTIRNDSVKQTIDLKSLKLGNLDFNDSFTLKPEQISNLLIQNAHVGLMNDKINLEVHNLNFSAKSKSIDIDSLGFSPVPDRISFVESKEFQSTYIQLYSGKISLRGFDYNRFFSDTAFYTQKILINDLRFLAYKDKRFPFEHTEKPMFTKLLLGFEPKIQFDSLIFRNGFVGYDEFNDKTEQMGHIQVTKMRGAITNFKTFGEQPTDSIKFNLYAKFMDTAELRINMEQSYTDSLSGFNLKFIVSPFDLTTLNPMLRPFASAELKSGYLDTLRMSVIGRKYMAFGIMKMYYRDLHVVYLNKGDSEHKNFVSRMISFVANQIVNKNNSRGTGEVYTERDNEKRFLNYWVKILIGGVLTNAGIVSNKKQERKYAKGLEYHHVPPIKNIPVDY